MNHVVVAPKGYSIAEVNTSREGELIVKLDFVTENQRVVEKVNILVAEYRQKPYPNG